MYLVGAYTKGVAGAKHGWLPGDLNKGRVDLFFLLLGGEPSLSASPNKPISCNEPMVLAAFNAGSLLQLLSHADTQSTLQTSSFGARAQL